MAEELKSTYNKMSDNSHVDAKPNTARLVVDDCYNLAYQVFKNIYNFLDIRIPKFPFMAARRFPVCIIYPEILSVFFKFYIA